LKGDIIEINVHSFFYENIYILFYERKKVGEEKTYTNIQKTVGREVIGMSSEPG
jgi:hypothetical protein